MALRVGAGRAEQLLAQTRRAMTLRNVEILRLREAQLPGGCPAAAAAPPGPSFGSTPQLHSRGTGRDQSAKPGEPDRGAEPRQAQQLRAALAASEAQRARDGAARDAELAALHAAHRKQMTTLQESLAAAHAKAAAGSMLQQEQQQEQQQQQQQAAAEGGNGPRTPEAGGGWRRPVLSLSSEEAAPSETRASAGAGRAALAAAAEGAKHESGTQAARVAELERQVLTWQQRCRDLERQLSAAHCAQAAPPGDKCMPSWEVLQEGFADKEILFPLHEYVSPGALQGALLGASASWQGVTAPAAQVVCQAAWAAGCPPAVAEIRFSEAQVNGHACHSLSWPQDATLPAGKEQMSGPAGKLVADARPELPFSMPRSNKQQQQQQWKRTSLSLKPSNSEGGSSLFSVGERSLAPQHEEHSAEEDAHLSLLLQACEAAVACPRPAHGHQQQEPHAELHAQEFAPMEDLTRLQEASVGSATR